MAGLLPAEYWEHRLTDVIVSILAALRSKEQVETLHIPGLGDCIPVRSARAAIVAALRALDLPAGARIGVPLYCCPVVFKAISLAGCRACFIDIDPGTFCLSPEDLDAKRSKVDAVIAVHMFGNPCDMPRVLDAAQGMPVIEDCAQSLGSLIDGRMAGSFGDAAAFSFRSGKYLSVGEGGALFAKHADIRSRLARQIADMSVASLAAEIEHAGMTYIRSMLRSKPLYGMVGHSLWNAYNRRVDYTDKTPIILGQMFKTDIALTRNRLGYLDSAIRKQRANADFYSRTLELDPGMLCKERSGAFYNRYLYPIAFSSSDCRDHMAAYLQSRQIGSLKPYRDVVEVAAANYGYVSDCPAAERAADVVLAIPSYHSLREADLQRIAGCLNDAWAKAAGVCGNAGTQRTAALKRKDVADGQWHRD